MGHYPEILKQFPATSYTAAFADSEQSELIAREYRILKYPALLFFRQHRFVGSLAGLYSWQEYSQRVAALLTTPGYRQDIPLSRNRMKGNTRESFQNYSSR